MVLNKELMLNRRTVESHKRMRKLAGEVQTLQLVALLKKLKAVITVKGKK